MSLKGPPRLAICDLPLLPWFRPVSSLGLPPASPQLSPPAASPAPAPQESENVARTEVPCTAPASESDGEGPYDRMLGQTCQDVAAEYVPTAVPTDSGGDLDDNVALTWHGNKFARDPQYGFTAAAGPDTSTAASQPPQTWSVFLAVLGNFGSKVKAPTLPPHSTGSVEGGHFTEEDLIAQGAQHVRDQLLASSSGCLLRYLVVAAESRSYSKAGGRSRHSDPVARDFDKSVRNIVLDILRGLPEWRILVVHPTSNSCFAGRAWSELSALGGATRWHTRSFDSFLCVSSSVSPARIVWPVLSPRCPG